MYVRSNIFNISPLENIIKLKIYVKINLLSSYVGIHLSINVHIDYLFLNKISNFLSINSCYMYIKNGITLLLLNASTKTSVYSIDKHIKYV